MKHKTALITGASRGIGRACAKLFAQNNYNLILTCIHSEALMISLKEELEQAYPIRCQIFLGDVGNPEDVKALFSQISELDVLLHNAGISYYGLLHKMSEKDWEQILHTNLSSAFYLSKYAIPYMLSKHSGKIISVSSVWGNCGAAMEVAYSASKGGLNSFTKALAKELAPSNIQVNAIACGLIDTDMNQNLSKEELAAIIDEIPACRIGNPEEVAALVLSLAQGHSYLTGQIITLDGGWC